jgi:hypothetical protein
VSVESIHRPISATRGCCSDRLSARRARGGRNGRGART